MSQTRRTIKRYSKGVSSGQGMIETVLVFILAFILFSGIIKMWTWGNRQLLYRATRYQATRKLAGQGHDKEKLPIYHAVGSVFEYVPPDIGNLASE